MTKATTASVRNAAAKAKLEVKAVKAANALTIKALATAKVKTLDQLQTAFVTASVNGEGSTLAFATGLTAEFGRGWEKIALAGPCSNPNEKALRDNIKTRKASLYAMLKAKGYSNPSVLWARVTKMASGPKPKGAKANAPRAMDTRQKEELSTLFKAFFNAEDCSPIACAVNVTIAAILTEQFKVDISTLKS